MELKGTGLTTVMSEHNRSAIFKWLCIIYGVMMVCLFVAGVCWLSIAKPEESRTYVIQYRDCRRNDNVEDVYCIDYLQQPGNEGATCVCSLEFRVMRGLWGVTRLYYKLHDYPESFSELFKSKDSSQWSGVLSPTPSEDCEPYRYTNTSEGVKPIVPCGALADAMFNDTFVLYNREGPLPMVETGLGLGALKEKYKNPSNSNETDNFSKPVNWAHNIWDMGEPELDEGGLRSERFIAWMEPDLARKPMARLVNETGLPPGVYTLKVYYRYPPSRYNGSRGAIIHSVQRWQYGSTPGEVLLALVVLLVVAGGIFYALWRKDINSPHQRRLGGCEFTTATTLLNQFSSPRGKVSDTEKSEPDGSKTRDGGYEPMDEGKSVISLIYNTREFRCREGSDV